MNSTKQLQLFDKFAAKLRETLVKKGSDYANETDVLANFKTSSKMAKITVMSVIIVEITKKVARIVNLSKKGKIAQNEPLEDSILDLCGYAFLLLCAVTERKDKAVNDTVVARELRTATHCVKDNEDWARFEGSYNDCLNYITKHMMRGGFIACTFDNEGKIIGIVNNATNETFLISEI